MIKDGGREESEQLKERDSRSWSLDQLNTRAEGPDIQGFEL
jgi:hypothetical protein